MFKVQKNDIIFNHIQTEQLLKHGKVTGRGKAYATGTVTDVLPSNLVPIGKAFANGTTSALLNKSKPLDNNLLYEKFKNLNLTQQFVPQFKVPDYSKTLASVENNKQSVSVGNIHVHCPGITKDEVAVQATEAIRKELFGIYNQGYQRLNKTR